MEPFTLKINDRDEVIAIIEGESINLGPRDIACEELRRFLAEIDPGDSDSVERTETEAPKIG